MVGRLERMRSIAVENIELSTSYRHFLKGRKSAGVQRGPHVAYLGAVDVITTLAATSS